MDFILGIFGLGSAQETPGGETKNETKKETKIESKPKKKVKYEEPDKETKDIPTATDKPKTTQNRSYDRFEYEIVVSKTIL